MVTTQVCLCHETACIKHVLFILKRPFHTEFIEKQPDALTLYTISLTELTSVLTELTLKEVHCTSKGALLHTVVTP